MDEDLLRDLFASLGTIDIKRMFGGQGIYYAGLIVAVVVDGELLLKADAATGPAFEDAGSRQWSYERDGRSPVRMPYFRLPDDALDDPSAMAEWAERAFGAARRAASAKTPSRLKRQKEPAARRPRQTP